MNGVIGSLRVNLGLDSAQFTKGAGRVEAPLKRMRRQFLAVAGGATLMGGAIAAAALAGARQIDEAAKSARRLDASIGGFRALELAAGEAGVSLSGLTNDIQTMNRELSTIGVSGNGQRALDALGLSVSQLEGLDADQKLALIADQVKSLGLDAGQTTAVLRDLGVRNREMALLVLQGGDAIRAARSDVEDYGLAISSVDAGRIEVANDRMARLGLVTQYAGQQLAVALVPALGRMAQAMTDSLREGGLLRAVIDGLTGNIERITTYAVVAVGVFGVRYVGAMVAARVATFSLAGGLRLLRTALISTGVGALIVGAGELVLWFQRLVEKVGGFGNALALLKDLAVEVFGRIGTAFSIVPAAVRAGAAQMNAFFAGQLADMAQSFEDFTWKVASGLNGIFGGSLEGARGLADGLRGLEQDALLAGGAARFALTQIVGTVTAPLDSLAAIRSAIKETADGAIDLSGSLSDVDAALDEVSGAGGGAAGAAAGGAAGAVAAGVKNIGDKVKEVEGPLRGLKSSFSTAFDALFDKTKGVRGALTGLLADFAKFARDQSFNLIWERLGSIGSGRGASGGAGLLSAIGGGLASAVGGLFGGLPQRAMGGPVSAGLPYSVNENTPRSEVFVPSQSGGVLNVPQAQAAFRGAMGGRGGQVFNVDARGAQEGVAQQIVDAIRSAGPQIAGQAVTTVRESFGAMAEQHARDGVLI